MTRRRADTTTPYDGTVVYELTASQREIVQEGIAERYQGRKDREAWDRRYWRGRTQVHVRARAMVGGPLRRAVGAILLAAWCASCATVPRVQPADVVVKLIQFHGAVADQFQAGGMELEHFLTVTSWIGDELRVLQTNPRQWEGQARLDWPRVKSICVPFESLEPWTRRLDGLLQ
jgi:hypothetical protein